MSRLGRSRFEFSRYANSRFSAGGGTSVRITIASDASGTLAVLTPPTGYVFTSQAVIITIPAANNGTEQTVSCTLDALGNLVEDTPGEFAADLILAGHTGALALVLVDIDIVPLSAYTSPVLISPFPDPITLTDNGAGYDLSQHFPPGTTLATATFGPNVLPAEDFSGGSGYWTVSGTDGTHIVTFAGTTMRYQSGTTTPVLNVQSPVSTLVIGQTYQITTNTSSYTSGSMKVDHSGGSTVIANAAGSKVGTIVANSTVLTMLRNSASVDLTMDAINVRRQYAALPSGVSIASGSIASVSAGNQSSATYVVAATFNSITEYYLFNMAVTVASAAPSITASDALVGNTLTVTVDSLTGSPAPSVSVTTWTLDAVDVSGSVTGSGPFSYVAPASQNSQTIAWELTATNGVGSDATASGSEVVPATAPSAAGPLSNQSFTQGTGVQTYDPSAEFSGPSLVYSINTVTGVSINSSTGVVSVNTGTTGVLSGQTITVTATNNANSASLSFSLNVTAASSTVTIPNGGTTLFSGTNFPASTNGVTIDIFDFNVPNVSNTFRDIWRGVSTSLVWELDTDTGNLRLYFEDGTGTTAVFNNYTITGVVPLATAHRLTLTSTPNDGTNAALKVWVNGSEVASGTNTAGTIPLVTNRAQTMFGEGIGCSFSKIEVHWSYFSTFAAAEAATPAITFQGTAAQFNDQSAMPSGWTKSGTDLT